MIDKMIEELKDYRLYATRNAVLGMEVAKHCIAIAEKYKADKCKWTLIDEEENVYDTDCRNPHILMNGTPKDNGYSYCPYCGKKIKVVE